MSSVSSLASSLTRSSRCLMMLESGKEEIVYKIEILANRQRGIYTLYISLTIKGCVRLCVCLSRHVSNVMS